MSYLHDEHDDDLEAAPQRELTLGTGTILSIFLGLALLCGGFFAFGYNMGSKARQAAAVDSATADSPSNNAAFDHFSKPAAGAPAIQPVPGYLSTKDAAAANSSAANTAYNTPATAEGEAPLPVAPSHPALASKGPTEPASVPVIHEPATAATVAPATAQPHAAPLPATTATGSFLVQVAAVSHQEDADLLVGALKRKGYTVAAHHEPDNLNHIQIGPFTTKKDAEAMRQRLLADGYNAILK